MRAVARRIAALALGSALLIASAARSEEIVVFAAASLKSGLDEIAQRYEAQTGDAVLLSYAGTPALARQIQQGAPAAIFVSANAEWMDVLEAEGLVVGGTRFDLVANRLALIASPGSAKPNREAVSEATLAPLLARATADDGPALAMAFTTSVPAGIYGRAALTSLGLWDALAASVVETENVRAALALVARGEVPFGIVYATDAAAEPDVVLAGIFDAATHPPIAYPAALVKGAQPSATAFLRYLGGDVARGIWDAHGFARP